MIARNEITGEQKFLIKWETKYELGIPSIDNQHKELVSLCDKFYQSIIAPNIDRATWQTNLIAALKECTAYVQTHFRSEEILMQAAGYKDFAMHKKQHEEFTQKILAMAHNFTDKNLKDAIQFAKFLYDWILSHVSYEDKKYVPCIKEYSKKQH